MTTIIVDEFPEGFNFIINDENLVHMVPGDTLNIRFPSGKYLQITIRLEYWDAKAEDNEDDDNILKVG